MVARVVARSVEELAEILQRLSMFADSSTSVVLETIIPLRNPIPAPLPAAAAKSLPGIARVRRNRVKRPAPPKGIATKLA